MSFQLLNNLDYLDVILQQAGYSEILTLCSSNSNILDYCKHNQRIKNLIINKKKEQVQKTDQFLSKLTPSQYAIVKASSMGDVDIVDELMRRRYKPDIDDNRAIQKASIKGHALVVNRLLQDPRVDPSVQNNLSIRWSSELGYLEVVNRLLQDHRVDPTVNDNVSIKEANANEHFDVVDILLHDPRVYQSLSKDEREFYIRQINRDIFIE